MADMSSSAERVAGILRDRITLGELLPGTRLTEGALSESLDVSRNTLREAFRLLTHERLLVHELNRGVFVRMLTQDDVAELYRVRRMIELAALRTAEGVNLNEVTAAVHDAEKAASEDRWQDVGTADLRFHRALVELAGSARIDQFMAQILAELRLVFHVMQDPRRFHGPYIGRNRDILAALERGDIERAEELLTRYLDDAERQLLDAYASEAHAGAAHASAGQAAGTYAAGTHTGHGRQSDASATPTERAATGRRAAAARASGA